MATKKPATRKKPAPKKAAKLAPKKAPAYKVALAANSSKRDQLLRAVLAGAVGRSRFASKAGLQYGTARDIYQVAGYVQDADVKFDHYWSLYKRGDIAGRIVDMPPKTTWRKPPDLSEQDHEEGTEFTKAFADFAKQVKLWHYLERVDRLAGVGRFAVLFIGARGAADDAQLKQPMTKLSGPQDVLYLQPYHEGNVVIDKWVTDAKDPRFGLPELYKLTVATDQQFGRPSNIVVHHSRVIHVAEDLLDNEVYGRPRLERALNRLFDLDKISASTGEAYWQNAVRILQAKVDPDAEIGTDQLKELDEKLGEMVHDLRRQFWGQGVELDWLSQSVPPVKDIGDFYFSLVAGAVGFPKRILFGSEMGELASSTDQQTWFGIIEERQEQFAEPQLLRAFVDRMIEVGGLPKPATGEYQVVWPELFKESEEAIAGANLRRAQIAQTLTPVGGDPREMIEIDDERNVWVLPRTAEEAEELREANEAAAEEAALAAEEAAAAAAAAAGAGAQEPGVDKGNAPVDGNGGDEAGIAGQRRRSASPAEEAQRLTWENDDFEIIKAADA